MIRILIVEDEKPISDLILLSLCSSGYECDTAYDGMEASDKLVEKIYDLVLLDIMEEAQKASIPYYHAMMGNM